MLNDKEHTILPDLIWCKLRFEGNTFDFHSLNYVTNRKKRPPSKDCRNLVKATKSAMLDVLDPQGKMIENAKIRWNK